jgi:hypothetical protein
MASQSSEMRGFGQAISGEEVVAWEVFMGQPVRFLQAGAEWREQRGRVIVRHNVAADEICQVDLGFGGLNNHQRRVILWPG